VVGIGGIIHALLYLMKKAAQLALIKREVLDVAGLLEEMESQQRHRVAGRSLSQSKDVKLPILLCTLQPCS